MNIAQLPMKDDRKTGYQFLSFMTKYINGKKVTGYHPGLDLNSGSYAEADRGLPVKPFSNGIVIFQKNLGSGWGNLIVVWHEHLKLWSRYAHFDTVSVKKGDLVTMDTTLGKCGSSGTQSPHCHFEIITKQLTKWDQYVWGWTKEKVMEYFASPYEYIKKINEEYEKNMLLPNWARDSWKRASDEGIAPENPHQEIDINLFQEMLKQRGIINSVGYMPAYRAFVVIDKMQGLL